jgi:hypothetical protein
MKTISDATEWLARATPNPEPGVPWLLRKLGAKWRDGKRSYRMSWGEMTLLRPGWGLDLHLFGDPPHFSIGLHLPWLVSLYVTLPFLRRYAREPHEIMESWGVSYSPETTALWLRWGRHYRMITMPWRDWSHIAHDVLRIDGTWAPYVGSWERDKEPDGRHIESYPYRYLLRNGEKQERTATIYVDRYEWRLRWLRWTRLFRRVSHYIDVSFSAEMGERTGSWKGGTIGCSYELRPGETPLECLRRMERDRRFT